MFVCGYNKEGRVPSTKESSSRPQQTLTWPKHLSNDFFHWHITITVWPQGVNGECHQIRKMVPSHQKRANRFRCVHPSPTLYTSVIIYYPIPCTTSVCDNWFPVYTPFVWFIGLYNSEWRSWDYFPTTNTPTRRHTWNHRASVPLLSVLTNS